MYVSLFTLTLTGVPITSSSSIKISFFTSLPSTLSVFNSIPKFSKSPKYLAFLFADEELRNTKNPLSLNILSLR